MRSSPEEMHEEFMLVSHERMMTKRDRARIQFIKEFRLKQIKKSNLRNIVTAERERFLDMQEQIRYQSAKPIKDMKYLELVEVLNRDLEAAKMLSG